MRVELVSVGPLTMDEFEFALSSLRSEPNRVVFAEFGSDESVFVLESVEVSC